LPRKASSCSAAPPMCVTRAHDASMAAVATSTPSAAATGPRDMLAQICVGREEKETLKGGLRY
jgi:hypothetical protein